LGIIHREEEIPVIFSNKICFGDYSSGRRNTCFFFKQNLFWGLFIGKKKYLFFFSNKICFGDYSWGRSFFQTKSVLGIIHREEEIPVVFFRRKLVAFCLSSKKHRGFLF
jgi:hypothetical protein